MNIDLASQFNFGDTSGLQTFFLDHQTVHDAEAAAMAIQFGGSYSTFGLLSPAAEEAWSELMRLRQGKTPQSLIDWLQFHAFIHNTTYQRLAGQGTVAPDLSIADFSKPVQFYDWMYVHQQMHDFEQATLGIK